MLKQPRLKEFWKISSSRTYLNIHSVVEFASYCFCVTRYHGPICYAAVAILLSFILFFF